MTRRNTRVDPHFFAELDNQLPESRGPNGEPSASDFLVIDLPTISDAFADISLTSISETKPDTFTQQKRIVNPTVHR